MNIKSIIYIAVAFSWLAAFGAETTPYSSAFYVDYSLDSGWSINQGNRKSKMWEKDRDSQSFPQGFNNGAVYYMDWEIPADTWLISPAIALTGGTEYVVGIWARTNSGNDSENFRVMVGTDNSVGSLSSSTALLDKRDYRHNSEEFEHFEAVFTPSETGDFYFGVNCYSEEWMGSLYVTGFTVTDAKGGNTDPTPDPSEECEELPYLFDFSSDPFAGGWKSVKGKNSVSNGWSYNSVSNFASLEITQELPQDDWLISPALKIDEAGMYSFDTSITTWGDGAMDVVLGTDPADISTFNTLIQQYESGEFRFQLQERKQIGIDIPGVYYVGFHACSEKSPIMDMRVHYLGVKLDAAVPSVVTDLSAKADDNDALEVNLSWTYPSLYNNGEPLEKDGISKAELFRNGDLVYTFENAVPGTEMSFIDRPETAGVYKYAIRVYGVKGYDTDNEETEVSAGFVGHPVVEFPYSYETSPSSDDVALMMTVEDANNDGITWIYDTSYSYLRQFITSPTAEGEMDDYLASPYIPLEAGYYKVTWKAGASNMSYRLGYATDRHALAETFTPVASFNSGDNETSGSSHTLVMSVPEAGEYVLVVHHTSVDKYSSYNKMTVKGFAIESASVLPDIVSGLNVEGSFESAIITWINPEHDNAGLPLADIEKVVISRNGKELVSLSDNSYLIPGATCTYTDSSVVEAGNYTYTVEVYNSNGKSELPSPVASAFVGHGLMVPCSSSDFHDWFVINADDDYSKWEYNYDGTEFSYSKYYGTSDDYALTPFIELENGKAYKFEINVSTTSNFEASLEFVAGQKWEADNLKKVDDMLWGPDEADEVKTFTFFFNTSELQTTEENIDDSYFTLPAGNNAFGVHATTGTRIILKSYSVSEDMSNGVKTLMAFCDGISYKAGMIHTSGMASLIRVISLDGKVLLEASDTDCLAIDRLTGGQQVIVTAVIDGKLATLKILL